MKASIKLVMSPELRANFDKLKELMNARMIEREVLLPVGQQLKAKITARAPRGKIPMAARSDEGRRRFSSKTPTPWRDKQGTKSIVARMRAFVPRKSSSDVSIPEVLVRSGAPHSHLVDKGGKNERRPVTRKVMAFIGRTGEIIFRKRVARMPASPYFDTTVESEMGGVLDQFADRLRALLAKVGTGA